MRNFGRCRLEFLAAAALCAPLELREILEGAGKDVQCNCFHVNDA